MSTHLEKLMAQFALLFAAVWVVAAALGKKDQAGLGSARRPRNYPGSVNAYQGDNSWFGCSRQAKYYQSSVANEQEASDTTAVL